jgi:hypothetical protein
VSELLADSEEVAKATDLARVAPEDLIAIANSARTGVAKIRRKAGP